MNRGQAWIVALLGVIALEGAVTAYEVVRIARNGFEVSLTKEQADEIVEEVEEAKAAAMEDMNNESN